MKDEIHDPSGKMTARKLVLDDGSYIIQLNFVVLSMDDGGMRRVDEVEVGDKIALQISKRYAAVVSIEEVPVTIFNEPIRLLRIDPPSKPTKKFWGDCAIIYTEQGGMMVLDVNTTIEVIGEDGEGNYCYETVKVGRLKQGDIFMNGQVLSNMIIESGPPGVAFSYAMDPEKLLMGRCKEKKLIAQLKIGEPDLSKPAYTLEVMQTPDGKGLAWTLMAPHYDDSWNGICTSFREVAAKALDIMGHPRIVDGLMRKQAAEALYGKSEPDPRAGGLNSIIEELKGGIGRAKRGGKKGKEKK